MYSCLLPEFHLTGALCRIPTVVPYCGGLLKLNYSQSHRIRGKPPVKITMYSCLLPEFHLTGALCRIPTVVPYCRGILKLDYSQSQSHRIRGKPPGPKRRNPGMNAKISMYGCLVLEFHLTGALRRILAGVPYCRDVLRLCIILKGKYIVHQVQPVYLARLNTTGRSPGIPEGAVKDRLTHWHSSLRHGTHTVGLAIVFQGLLL